MDLPVRPERAQVGLEESRLRDTHIRQEGSRFRDNNVSGGILLQGNFTGGITISKRSLIFPIYRAMLTTSRLQGAIRLRRPVLPLLARASEGVRATTFTTRPD